MFNLGLKQLIRVKLNYILGLIQGLKGIV